jgi:hypothetical protein
MPDLAVHEIHIAEDALGVFPGKLIYIIVLRNAGRADGRNLFYNSIKDAMKWRGYF